MDRKQQVGPIGGLIFGLVLAVIGYFVAFTFGKPILDNAKASQKWPTVPGEITRSAVSTKRSNGKTTYGFDVEYRYKVEGQELTCSNVFFGGNSSSSDSTAAYRVTRRYSKHTKVEVYYDPQQPANAVLEPGAHWQSYLLYGIGLAFLVVGVLSAGASLFYVLAAGAIIGGTAIGWLGGSSTRTAPSDGFDPDFPPNRIAPRAPPRADAKEDDGFTIH